MPDPELPPPDNSLSPHTGWARAHWEALADRLLAGVVPYASPGGALYRLPGRASVSGARSDGLEGFARSFLLAALRLAGGEGGPALAERYARGLAAGTDPAGGERWPPIEDRSQPMVEAASVAIALYESRPWIWDRLYGPVQERVVDWLSGFTGRRTWDNNWRLFQVISQQFLASVGAPHSGREIESGLDRLEDWYRGDGWYTDGDGEHFDHYNAWALHLYPLLWSRMTGGGDGGRGALYRQRLHTFLRHFPRFFGADGAPLHHGRSLTYRFAAAVPVWTGALFGCTPLSPGLTRRLASGAAAHFARRGVPDARGLLRLGWYGTFLPATQPYSGPASPYWASKAFLGLLLPAAHPVWTAPELPLPVEESDFCTALPAPGWLLHGTRADGVVRLLNHGGSRSHGAPEGDPHYAKAAYSTATAPETGGAAARRAVDGAFAFLGPGGAVSRSGPARRLSCSGRRASSRFTAQLDGHQGEFEVETVSLVYGGGELRLRRFRAPQGVGVREGGYAVAGERAPYAASGPGWALARTGSGLTSMVVALHGWGAEAGVATAEDANAYGPRSATPYLRLGSQPGGAGLQLTLVALGRGLPGPEEVRAGLEVCVRGSAVEVVLPGGERVEL